MGQSDKETQTATAMGQIDNERQRNGNDETARQRRRAGGQRAGKKKTAQGQ